MKTKKIGIVGGVGPFAGLDLFKKVFDATDALTDQEHLDVMLHSFPGSIPDRTEFLINGGSTNPADGLFDVVRSLASASVDIIGIPCNTTHANRIWQPLNEKFLAEFPHIILVNMIEEVCLKLRSDGFESNRIGIMATEGTVASAVYSDSLEANGMVPVYPSSDIQHGCVQDAIYNKEYGIKAFSNPTTEKSREQLLAGIDDLIASGVSAVILGCTEIPLVITENVYRAVPLYDSTLILARKLVSLVDPNVLKE